MKTEEKLLKLIQRLLEKTKSGETRWEDTANRGHFQTSFPNYVVIISLTGNDYTISILDEVGEVIESADDNNLTQAFPQARVFATMRELYELARRDARGVDAALDSLLGELA